MTTLRQLAVKMVAELSVRGLLLQGEDTRIVAVDVIDKHLNGWIREMRDKLRAR